MPIAKIVLDVLKPRELPLTSLVERLCQLEGVEAVSADVIEVDAMTETLKLTVEGPRSTLGAWRGSSTRWAARSAASTRWPPAERAPAGGSYSSPACFFILSTASTMSSMSLLSARKTCWGIVTSRSTAILAAGYLPLLTTLPGGALPRVS